MTGLAKLQHLIEALSQKYEHIIGEQVDFPPKKMIENIISYYEDIINSLPGNVYWLDRNCITVGCNKNVLDMFGFSSIDQFKGLNFEEMGKAGRWTDEATQSFKHDTLEVVRTGTPKLNVEEPPIPHSDGRTIHFLSSRVPLFDLQRNVIGIVGISIDISELKNTQAALKKAKEQAEAASLAKSEFVANMSHDVKTPLSGIIGISELLTYRLQNNEERDFAQTILVSGRQLLNFFDNCLEVFKLENNGVALASESFSLKNLIKEIYELFNPAIKTKGLLFTLHYPNHIPDNFIGSRSGIYRILLNLVGNAVKFTHHGSISIRIDLEENSSKTPVKITIEDTGIGITKDKQKIIFERFTRLIPSYKGIYEGSGIGLYIVQKFLDAMQGEIHINSDEGKGSQFIVTVPLQILQDENKNLPNYTQFIKSHDYPISSVPVKILLVEDNLTTQWMQSSLLSSINCQVDVVNSGEKALEIFTPGKYDLIFMDIGLPGMQGDVVSKHIRKIEEDSGYHVPIIALTAHIAEDSSKHFLNAGMEDILSKPISREQAKQIIDQYYLSIK